MKSVTRPRAAARKLLFATALSSAVLLAAPLAATAQTASNVPYACGDTTAGPRTCADSGFRSNIDGFSFQNYGNPNKGRDPSLPMLPYPYTDLTPAEMTYLFGLKVCSNAQASPTNCTLTPPAANYVKHMNDAVGGGHCFGFSWLALAYRKNQLAHTLPTHDYKIAGNPSLQGLLAYAWNTYLLDSMQRNMFASQTEFGKPNAKTPNDVLDKLVQVLKPDSANPKNDETYTLSVYKRKGPNLGTTQGGHSITPYAVTKDSPDPNDQKYTVLAYDNNKVDEVRRVYFDRRANTFKYNAQLNPGQIEEEYEGNGTVGTALSNNIELAPTKPALGSNQTSPILTKYDNEANAAAAAAAGSGTVDPTPERAQVELVGGNPDEHAHLAIDDGDPSHRVGYQNGETVDNFSGATHELAPVFDDYNETAEPTYRVPQTVKDVMIDGRALHKTTTQSLGLENSGQSVGIDDLPIRPGQYDVLRLNNGINDMTFTSNQAIVGNPFTTSPTLRIGADNPDMDPDLRLKVLASPAGNTLRITLNPTNRTMTLQTSISGVYQFSGTDETPTRNYQLPTRTVAVTVAHPVTVSYAY